MVLRILGMTARRHTYSILLVLVASVVQGLTPAQQSLASSWGLVHFLSIQDFSNSAGDENDPAEEECLSTEPVCRLDFHHLARGMEALSNLIPRTIEVASPPFRCAEVKLLSQDHLSIVLCRLTC
jgi:hypothetical protein